MSLKEKAVGGFGWTAFEGFFSQGVVFIVGIILARLLSPVDFGIIGIITVFIAISESLVAGGFGDALVRKIGVSDKDFNTVFYSNICVSSFLYLVLFLFSGHIADYFEEESLEILLKYSGLIIIINSFSIVQYAILTIKLNFKVISIAKVASSIISAIIALYLAFNDYGIWSLVVLSILRPLINCIILWSLNRWRPSLIFSINSFKNLFDFGYKILISNLIDTIYRNLYYFLIGKFFSPKSLGYYTRADQFRSPFSTNISFAISRISYPILSSLQEDKDRFKRIFRQFLRFSALLNFTIMLSIAAIAKPLVLLTIGEKWTTSIFYLQILCIPGMLYPLQILNINLLTALGYSNLMLKNEILKKIILIPLILLSAIFSIEIMLYGLVLFSIIELFINSIYSKKLIEYSIIDQIRDIAPFLIISIVTFFLMFLISFFNLSLIIMIICQIIVGGFTFFVINEKLKLNEYLEIKSKVLIILNKIIKRKKST